MEGVIASLVAGVPVMVGQFLVTMAVLVVGVLIYQSLTPVREAEEIGKGNNAAALSFGAAVLGLAIPLAACMANSINALDIALWGIVAVVLQLAVFFGLNLIFRDLSARITRGELAPAIAMTATKLAVALINAAAVSG